MLDYGNGNRWIFKEAVGATWCTTAAFGKDPWPGVPKECHVANLYKFASEGGTIHFAFPTNEPPAYIAYGAGARFAYKYVTNGDFSCTSATFGTDPYPGVTKSCYEVNPDYWLTYNEGEMMHLSDSTPLFYGGNDRYIFTIGAGDIPCASWTFGDPAPGVAKVCKLLKDGASWLADQWGTIPQQVGRVAYGSGLNGRFLYKASAAAGTPCTDDAFGGDPDVGVPKHRWSIVQNPH